MEILEDRNAWYETYKNGWLAHYQETNETNFKIYNRPSNENVEGLPGLDLSKSRLILITSAGSYLKDSQEPYDAAHDLGDYSIRTYPTTTAFDALAYAHTHYDHTAVNQDPQVLVPLRHLEDLVSEGVIGELATEVISYMGYQPDVLRTIDETTPAVIEAAKKMAAHAALLVPS